jgi:hypothetical protein
MSPLFNIALDGAIHTDTLFDTINPPLGESSQKTSRES